MQECRHPKDPILDFNIESWLLKLGIMFPWVRIGKIWQDGDAILALLHYFMPCTRTVMHTPLVSTNAMITWFWNLFGPWSLLHTHLMSNFCDHFESILSIIGFQRFIGQGCMLIRHIKICKYRIFPLRTDDWSTRPFSKSLWPSRIESGKEFKEGL